MRSGGDTISPPPVLKSIETYSEDELTELCRIPLILKVLVEAEGVELQKPIGKDVSYCKFERHNPLEPRNMQFGCMYMECTRSLKKREPTGSRLFEIVRTHNSFFRKNYR